MMRERKLPKGRERLVLVIRASEDVIKIDDVVTALNVGRVEASKLLSRWVTQGWLRRVARGVYLPAQLDSLNSEHVLEDPWVLVPAIYSPAYIGGWSAAEYWDLTEQLFRDILVFTAQPVRKNLESRHGARFSLHHISQKKLFGLKPIWRGSSKILVSDVHRTLIDMLSIPAIGGGIQHVADCFVAYLKHLDRNDKLLIENAIRLGNGAVFKRLGFLAEHQNVTSGLLEICQAHLTKGNAKLDPALQCNRLISRWRLWIPQSWIPGNEHD